MKFLFFALLLSLSAFAQEGEKIIVPDDAFVPSAAGTPKKKVSEEDFAWMKKVSKLKKTKKHNSALHHCEMSMDEKEITCGDRVYTLSGKGNNMARINSKIDLKDSSSPNSSSSFSKKVKHQ